MSSNESSSDDASSKPAASDDDEDEEYFESSSSSSASSGNSGDSFRGRLLSQRPPHLTDKVLFQLNSEDLHRQELGGIVVYDSYARIVGNSHLMAYYDRCPPSRVDFHRLFSRQEIGKADRLFYKEPRERDFQNDFDKFLFKHLPKFAPQREFNFSLGGTYTISVPQHDNILIFDSRFECGNLRRAIKVNNVEYNIWLENDVNTKGHTQWFYFKVTRPKVTTRRLSLV